MPLLAPVTTHTSSLRGWSMAARGRAAGAAGLARARGLLLRVPVQGSEGLAAACCGPGDDGSMHQCRGASEAAQRSRAGASIITIGARVAGFWASGVGGVGAGGDRFVGLLAAVAKAPLHLSCL
jgi:hypothetical protein